MDCPRHRSFRITNCGFCEGIKQRPNTRRIHAFESDFNSFRRTSPSRSQDAEFISNEQFGDMESGFMSIAPRMINQQATSLGGKASGLLQSVDEDLIVGQLRQIGPSPK